MSDSKHQQFVELLSQHRTQLFGYLYALLRNLTDAEDLYQQTSLVLWRKFDQFRPGTSFVGWACAVAQLEVRNFLRKQRRNRHYFSDEFQSELAELQASIDPVETDARRDALAGCIQKLSPPDRELIESCYAGKDSFKQISARLGRTAQSIYDALSRIRSALLHCIERAISQEGRP